MSDIDLDLIQKILSEDKREYSVYALINYTKKEIYFGISKQLNIRYFQHMFNTVDSTSHWNFGNDDTERQVIRENLTKKEASDLAHKLEKTTFNGFEDFKIIQTGGA
ncbi:GIY-YIG nuclease family protein [Fodinibius salsisoli]|uniref:GIY-YIG nuclease family protein n=1 Tax=Fodinibius salsisoli TaxID=2820877 RepID=A0ABT3PTR4_9BACT|nr:GIY-YIG nuclease family protein [Fodinibius salsisoli]MCW9709261.1 GIY-YIG nuclease family protein [Fodinibius salsisoli]